MASSVGLAESKSSPKLPDIVLSTVEVAPPAATMMAEQPQCKTDSGGSCWIFSCYAWRGPTDCTDSDCVCKEGYCANEQGVCMASPVGLAETMSATMLPEIVPSTVEVAPPAATMMAEQPQCKTDSGGSCWIFSCYAWRGPTDCTDSDCVCKQGYCANEQGVCMASPVGLAESNSSTMFSEIVSSRVEVAPPAATMMAEQPQCKTESGGSCWIFSCYAWRGPTDCTDSDCVCKEGYCANDQGVCMASPAGLAESTSLTSPSPASATAVLVLAAGAVSSVVAAFGLRRARASGNSEPLLG